MAATWLVHKFEGLGAGRNARFEQLAVILQARAAPVQAVVVSEPPVGEGALAAIREHHAALANELLSREAAAIYVDQIERDISEASGALIARLGAHWSSRLLALVLARRTGRPVRWLDARHVLTVDDRQLGPSLDWDSSRARIAAAIAAGPAETLVMAGGVACRGDGELAELGSDGGDFSASALAALLAAKEMVLWTNSDGVASADRERVPEATAIDQLSYDEAMELAYYGAGVIRPWALTPAISRGVPIWIKNVNAPEQLGTLICARPDSARVVKGLTSIDRVALINVEGAGMIGVPGTAQRLFGALRDAGVSVILISQGSSEHSICCAVPGADGQRAKAAALDAFAQELRTGQVQSVSLDAEQSILAIVGDAMAGSPGVAAKLFAALSAAGVNVRAIAQGASERNISVVVSANDATRALRAAHAGFYLSPYTLALSVIGPGAVGGAFLDQLALQSSRLGDQFGLNLRLIGLMGSQRMLLSDAGIEIGEWRGAFGGAKQTADLPVFCNHARSAHLPHSVLIDCSADESVAHSYSALFERGVHVITPNKKANSGAFSAYTAMREARRRGGAHYLYEATVGAGLPIIQTVRDLRETGDDIFCIEGILSGTLAYLFNVWDGGAAFSEIVQEAKRLGYTEPDPRDDLSGLDVARKLVILAREIGLATELEDISVESLAPRELQGLGVADFLSQLPRFDAAMKRRFEAARDNGKVLRHVGCVEANGMASVGLVELDAAHPFANIALTDNVVCFRTRRYNANPLIVRGPGAGPEVTAGGVFADLLRLASYLGARL